MRKPRKPKKGDIIKVVWTDITGDQLGDPNKATVTTCITTGFFHRYKMIDGKKCLITSLTYHPADSGRVGSDAYQVAVIKQIKILEAAEDVYVP